MSGEGLSGYFQRRGVAQLPLGGGMYVPGQFADATAEHLAVRDRVGLFDFSFMSQFQINGPDAITFLERLQPRPIAQLRCGRIAYTFLCRDDGSVFNDATIWRRDNDLFWLFTGRRSDAHHIRQAAENLDVRIEDLSGSYSIIGVQGPLSDRLLQHAGVDPDGPLRYFRFSVASWNGVQVWVGRIGYSGERGFEVLVQAGHGSALWQHLVAAGRDLGVAECGFRAADSLRIEAGYILFAQELRFRISPAGLGYGRIAALGLGGDFIGAAALRRRGRQRIFLAGLVPLRAAAVGWRSDSVALPDVELPPVAPGRACLTSACWSPTFSRPLGLGYVADVDRHPGSTVRLQDGQWAQVARLPYYDPPRIVPRR